MMFDKQNDAIHSSLMSNNVEVPRIIVPAEINHEEYMKFLQVENKEVIVADKFNDKDCATVKVTDKHDEEDELLEDPVKHYDCTFNMENIKRSFFSDDLATFEQIFWEQTKNGNLKCYYGDYKRDYDYDGSPEFVARNLVRKFVKQFEDFRKYSMVCFRCSLFGEKKYHFTSLWLTNVKEPLTDEDFNLMEVKIDDTLKLFVQQIKKTNHNTEFAKSLLAEMYLH